MTHPRRSVLVLPGSHRHMTEKAASLPAAGTCTVMVKFTPPAAQKYSGTLVIDTNLEQLPDRSVKLEGTGKTPKP